MSVVTNVILTFSNAEEPKEILSRLRGFGEQRPPVDVSGLKESHGGSKYLECPVALAAFNHLDEEEFWGSLQEIKWQAPECVRVMLERQWDDRFRVYDIARNELRYPPATKLDLEVEQVVDDLIELSGNGQSLSPDGVCRLVNRLIAARDASPARSSPG